MKKLRSSLPEASTSVSIKDRTNLINSFVADLMISLHTKKHRYNIKSGKKYFLSDENKRSKAVF